MTSNDITFAQRVTAFREARGMTKTAFARELGYGPSYQYYVEGGQRQPTVAYVDRLIEAFGVKQPAMWHRAGAREHGWRV